MGVVAATVKLDGFNEAIQAAANKLKESGGDVSQALGKLKGSGTLGELIKKLAEGLGNFIGYEGTAGTIKENKGIGQRPKDKSGNGDANNGKPYESREKFISEYRTKVSKGYYLSYNPANAKWGSWDAKTSEAIKCAKIFLGAIPLIFNKLSYLYWRCHNNGGGWHQMQLNGRDTHGGHLGNFIYALDYHFFNLNDKMTGDKIVQTAMNGKFQDFAEGMTTAQQTAKTRAGKEDAARKNIYMDAQFQVNQNPTYLEFIAGCNEKLNDKIKTASNPSSDLANHSLSALHLLASCYFRCQQNKRDTASSRPPSTIREMLYFLAALPFSPNYYAVNTYITDHFKKLSGESDAVYDAALMIAVADSSTTAKHNTLSAANLKNHLISTCSFSTAFLGMIQGPGASEKSEEPWLYELYCNSAFNLKYPSGAALVNALAKYSYAVQFQINFLYWQCSDNGRRCGWQYCTFGSAFTPQKESEVVTSHLCHADCKNHSTKQCIEHNFYNNTQCGKESGQGSPSPLQAFLTDCLSGFCRNIPGTSNHLTTCSGPCHAPMGFKAVHLRGVTKIGRNIMSALIPFCSSESSPLTQLSEKLACLTKRTPRTLGDLFGFLWHLNSQLFGIQKTTIADLAAKLVKPLESNPTRVPEFLRKILKTLSNSQSASQSPSVLSRSLEAMATVIPFLYEIFMGEPNDSLPTKLFELKSSKHNGTHNDLYSLYNQSCSGQNTCGQYLRPLCYSNGATFAPTHAASYLSWVLYLSDDLLASFGEMLHEFNNIDCSNMDRGPPLKEREVHASARRPALPSAAPALAVACGA